MEVLNVVYICIACGGVILSTIIPITVKLFLNVKKYRQADTEAEKAAILLEISELMKNSIEEAEEVYKDMASALYANNIKIGTLKKDSVISKLQNYCIERNVKFDREYWSNKIDETIEFTKKINKRG